MKPEPKSFPAFEPPANGCIKTIQHCPFMIAFVGKRMTWCFNWSFLAFVVQRANPDCRDPQVDPPHELAFHFLSAKVTLLGWRLDLMSDDIARHRISRVWKVNGDLAGQNREVAWISEIFVAPTAESVRAEYWPTEPPVSPETRQLN